jgi:hypothetical protein
MEDKTEELRDIFQSVADEDTVTESQEDARGSLATDEAGVDEAIADVVARMRDRYEFETDLPEDVLVTVVREFFGGADDAAIAGAIDAEEETVFRARLDLHLVREDDAPVDTEVLRRQFADATDETVAKELGVPIEDVHRARAVLETRTAARRVSDRFRAAFEDAVADAAISSPMTAGVRDDGLDEATEDIDSLESDADVDF